MKKKIRLYNSQEASMGYIKYNEKTGRYSVFALVANQYRYIGQFRWSTAVKIVKKLGAQ